MVERVEHFIKGQDCGCESLPFKIRSAGCTAEWDEHGLGIRIVYPYIEGVTIPGAVLIQYNASQQGRVLYVTRANIASLGSTPLALEGMTFAANGNVTPAGAGWTFCCIDEMPYLFQALVAGGLIHSSFRIVMSNLAFKLWGGHINDVPDHQIVIVAAGLDRSGQMREKLAFWEEYGREMNELLGQNVRKFESGKRPSDMMELTRIPGQEATADRVLGRDLEVLERLGWMDDEFGVPPGALELLADKH